MADGRCPVHDGAGLVMIETSVLDDINTILEWGLRDVARLAITLKPRTVAAIEGLRRAAPASAVRMSESGRPMESGFPMMTASEVALARGLHVRSITRQCHDKTIRGAQKVGGRWLIPVEIDDYDEDEAEP